MITSIPVRIASGDAAPTGVGWLGPGGLGWRGGSAPWVDVAMIGPTECHRMKHPIKGAAGGAAAAAAASLFAGPVGVAAAALIGAASLGLKSIESFEILTTDGRRATIVAPVGTSHRAREWHTAARIAATQVAPALPAPTPARGLRFWK